MINECSPGSIHIARRATASVELPIDLAVEIYHSLKLHEMRHAGQSQEGTCSHNRKATLSESLMSIISENYTGKANELGWMKDMVEKGSEENKRLHHAVKDSSEKYWASERMVNQLARQLEELQPKDKSCPEKESNEN